MKEKSRPSKPEHLQKEPGAQRQLTKREVLRLAGGIAVTTFAGLMGLQRIMPGREPPSEQELMDKLEIKNRRKTFTEFGLLLIKPAQRHSFGIYDLYQTAPNDFYHDNIMAGYSLPSYMEYRNENRMEMFPARGLVPSRESDRRVIGETLNGWGFYSRSQDEDQTIHGSFQQGRQMITLAADNHYDAFWTKQSIYSAKNMLYMGAKPTLPPQAVFIKNNDGSIQAAVTARLPETNTLISSFHFVQAPTLMELQLFFTDVQGAYAPHVRVAVSAENGYTVQRWTETGADHSSNIPHRIQLRENFTLPRWGQANVDISYQLALVNYDTKTTSLQPDPNYPPIPVSFMKS